MSLTDIAFQLLQPAINLGLSEFEFWDMTKVEIERYIEGATWRLKMKAQFDYSQANLIGLAYARVKSDSVTFPDLEDAYPSIFAEELKERQEQKQLEEIRIKNSRNRFLAFALQHNAKMKQGVDDNNL